MRFTVQAEFKLFGVLKQADGWWIAYCPALDITSQGRTTSEAKRNLAEACSLFVVSCFERGTFEQAMRELGWTVVSGKPATLKGKALEAPTGAFHFPIPVPFGFEKAAGCLA